MYKGNARGGRRIKENEVKIRKVGRVDMRWKIRNVSETLKPRERIKNDE